MYGWQRFLRPSVRTYSKYRSRGQLRVAWLAIASALTLAITLRASELFAADDIQQIKIGMEILYVPKAWIGFDSVWAGASSGAEIKIPQPGIADVAQLGMRPNSRWQSYSEWRPSSFGPLPTFINIGYGVALPALSEKAKQRVSEQYEQLFRSAETLSPDTSSFVRIAMGIARPGQPPEWERFLYKGYRDQFGEPLIIDSSNNKMVQSQVTIHARQDMTVNYRFDNKQFPVSTWWDLYKRTLAFIDYLQTPK